MLPVVAEKEKIRNETNVKDFNASAQSAFNKLVCRQYAISDQLKADWSKNFQDVNRKLDFIPEQLLTYKQVSNENTSSV
eukprot:14185761-Ditylum_brightwellii.AAC.1